VVEGAAAGAAQVVEGPGSILSIILNRARLARGSGPPVEPVALETYGPLGAVLAADQPCSSKLSIPANALAGSPPVPAPGGPRVRPTLTKARAGRAP
jgi:hypothetical protein